MKCIVCESEIKQLYPELNQSPIEQASWDDGAADTFTCGYGSIHDLNVYEFGICDKCISKKEKSGTIKFRHNLMHPEFRTKS